MICSSFPFPAIVCMLNWIKLSEFVCEVSPDPSLAKNHESKFLVMILKLIYVIRWKREDCFKGEAALNLEKLWGIQLISIKHADSFHIPLVWFFSHGCCFSTSLLRKSETMAAFQMAKRPRWKAGILTDEYSQHSQALITTSSFKPQQVK